MSTNLFCHAAILLPKSAQRQKQLMTVASQPAGAVCEADVQQGFLHAAYEDTNAKCTSDRRGVHHVLRDWNHLRTLLHPCTHKGHPLTSMTVECLALSISRSLPLFPT